MAWKLFVFYIDVQNFQNAPKPFTRWKNNVRRILKITEKMEYEKSLQATLKYRLKHKCWYQLKNNKLIDTWKYIFTLPLLEYSVMSESL